jgi:ATP-dependent DNA helicase RecG
LSSNDFDKWWGMLRERQMTTAELAAVVQRTDAETRSLLTRMVERGWIQARGEGKARSWHLSASVYRVLDAPSGYVRVPGFEPLQQEQMIKGKDIHIAVQLMAGLAQAINSG